MYFSFSFSFSMALISYLQILIPTTTSVAATTPGVVVHGPVQVLLFCLFNSATCWISGSPNGRPLGSTAGYQGTTPTH